MKRPAILVPLVVLMIGSSSVTAQTVAPAPRPIPKPDRAAVLEKGPYLQGLTGTSVQIRWQAKENVRVARRELSDDVRHEVDRVNSELSGRGRVLVRPSGTEPVIRVLAEAETDKEAAELCASITALVQQQLG